MLQKFQNQLVKVKSQNPSPDSFFSKGITIETSTDDVSQISANSFHDIIGNPIKVNSAADKIAKNTIPHQSTSTI